MKHESHATRRDKVYVASRRMTRLSGMKAATAWAILAHRLYDLSAKDVPKFDDLYRAIRGATVEAKKYEPGTNNR